MSKAPDARNVALKQGLKRGFLAMVALIVVYGCGATTNLVDMWRDPSFQPGPMKSMLVVAIQKSPVGRRLWEDVFVAELSKYGTVATPSYRLFPNDVPDTTQVIEAVRTGGYDGVLVTRRLDPIVTTNYVSGYTTTDPVRRYRRLTGTYDTYYREVYHPGYIESDSLARHEVNVWTTRENQLVWAGTGETLNGTSREAIRNEITRLVVPELARQGIISVKR